MSNKNPMTREELREKVEEYLANGGEIVQLRYAAENDLNKSRRNFFHKDKAIAGSKRSEDALAREDDKEKTLIFSKTDRWRKK
jgi:hypothetical protein